MRTELSVYQNIREQVQSFSNLLRFHTFVKKNGRKLALSLVDIVSIALFKQAVKIETKKSVYELLELEDTCSYKTLVVNMNRWYFLAVIILNIIFKSNRINSHLIKHTDATSIPVCLNKNAKRNKTMQHIASWAHDGKGYYFGLDLHLTSDLYRKMLAVKFTSAGTNVRETFVTLNDHLYGLFIADAEYVSKELERQFHVEGRRWVLISPRKNMKKLATFLDILIYRTRMLIELNFRNLKMFFGLITSLPRSVDGYFANYTYSLLAYALA